MYLSIYLHIYLRYLTTHTYMYAYMLGQGRDKGRRRICFNYAMRAQTHTAVPSTHFRIHDLISSSNSWRRIKCSLHPLGFQTDEVGQLLWILSSVKVHRLANKVLYKCNLLIRYFTNVTKLQPPTAIVRHAAILRLVHIFRIPKLH